MVAAPAGAHQDECQVQVLQQLVRSLSTRQTEYIVVPYREVVVRYVESDASGRAAGRHLLRLLGHGDMESTPGMCDRHLLQHEDMECTPGMCGCPEGTGGGRAPPEASLCPSRSSKRASGPTTGGEWAPPAASQWKTTCEKRPHPAIHVARPGVRRPAAPARAGGRNEDTWEVSVKRARRAGRWEAGLAASKLAGKIWVEKDKKKKEEKAAVCIQAAYRRRRAALSVLELKENAAAAKLQRAVRVWLSGRPQPRAPKQVDINAEPLYQVAKIRPRFLQPGIPIDDEKILQAAIVQADQERAELLRLMAPVTVAVTKVLQKRSALCPDDHKVQSVKLTVDIPCVEGGCSVCGLVGQPEDILLCCDLCEFKACTDCCPAGIANVVSAVKKKHGIAGKG